MIDQNKNINSIVTILIKLLYILKYMNDMSTYIEYI